MVRMAPPSANPHTINPTSLHRSPLPTADMSKPSSSSLMPVDGAPDAPTRARETTFPLGTRKSALAIVQTELVAGALRQLHPSPGYDFPIEWMSTVGDRNQSTPLHLLTPYSSTQPAKSLWTDELEARLMKKDFDMIVHSLKDVPTTLKEGCELGCMLKREDPRDALVVREGLEYKRLEDLPDGAIVGTGSVRRVAQLKRAFPNLKFEDMRGNLNTRLAKLDSPTSPFAALILAIAGLERLSLGHRITTPLDAPVLMHAVGQGALGVEIRAHDPRVRETLRGVGHWQTEWTTGAERACLRVLEGGCSVPVGIHSELVEITPEDIEDQEAFGESSFQPLQGDSPMLHFSGILPPSTPLPTPEMSSADVEALLAPRFARLSLTVCVTSLDGSQHVVHSPPEVIVGSYRGAEKFGEECARALREKGASEILDEITRIRKEREQRDLEIALEKSRAGVQAAVTA